MLLKMLLDGAGYSSDSARDTEVTGVFADSAKVLPGGVFVAIRGLHNDGAAFAGVKIDGGLYLAGKTADKDLSFDALLKADREENESRIAAELFGSPAKEKSE